MSQRAIGAQVDLHHDTAGQIGEAAAEVLGVAKRVYRLVLGEVKYDVRGQVAAHLRTADSNPAGGTCRGHHV